MPLNNFRKLLTVQEEDMLCVPKIYMFWWEICSSTSEQKPREEAD